jgi:hypothetical protein
MFGAEAILGVKVRLIFIFCLLHAELMIKSGWNLSTTSSQRTFLMLPSSTTTAICKSISIRRKILSFDTSF